MPSQEWKVTNKVEGTWTQDDTLSALQVVLNISYTPDFAFQNLYISGEIQRGDLTLWKDTFSIQLAKPNSGQWLGRMEGNAIFISDTISDPISLSPGQRLSYQFSQFSRKEVLKGIDRVSVTIVDQ